MVDGHLDYVPMQNLLDAGLYDICALVNSTTPAGHARALNYVPIPKHCRPTEPTSIGLDQANPSDTSTPSFRLDYVLASSDIARKYPDPHANVVMNPSTRVLSDHFPLLLQMGQYNE